MNDEKNEFPPPYSFLMAEEVKYAVPVNTAGETAESDLPGVIHHAAAFAHVEMQLTDSQSVLADGGSMIWKDASVRMDTQMGECLPSCWRQCAGESCCQNLYTGPGKVALSFKLPGDMKGFIAADGNTWKLSAGAFVCGTSNCLVSTQFAGCFAFLCGGEEAWMSKVSSKDDNPATFFAGGYGALTRHEIPEGNTMMMSSGVFFAAPGEHPFELRMPGGCFSCCCGGEGLVVSMSGPVVLYTQNRDAAIWHTILRREGVKKKQKSGAAQ